MTKPLKKKLGEWSNAINANYLDIQKGTASQAKMRQM
jgi:hypothetical protein